MCQTPISGGVEWGKIALFRLLYYLETAMIDEVIPKVGRMSIPELQHPVECEASVGRIVTTTEFGVETRNGYPCARVLASGGNGFDHSSRSLSFGSFNQVHDS